MVSDSVKVWGITGLVSLMMLIFLLSTYSPENVITGAYAVDSLGNNSFYWVGLLIVIVVGIVVYLSVEYGSSKKRNR